ncbi:hypothetical protein V1512DRAFT_273646 [Lipomyces arxii]|uniref:uncharacterized protein n=1 Tax=Lipomyces arxii TaxID=56418 RepID=UPI0034CFD734
MAFWKKNDTAEDESAEPMANRSDRMSTFSNSYELSNISPENSYSGAHSSVYGQSYDDNAPLRENAQPYAQNPWDPSQSQHLPPDMPPPGFVPHSVPPIDEPLIMPESPKQKIPWFTIFVSVVQICVFIGELVNMHHLTGSVIQTQPTLSPMIGPSTNVLINMGARYSPCMHEIPGITDSKSRMFPCPSSTTVNTDTCTLSQLCGMGGVGSDPNQWWRFITPIFIHAGFVHIIFNMLLQLQVGVPVERQVGSLKFAFIYLMCGVCGFILGGNYAADGVASTGASGALFGLVAITILDLLFNWKMYERPKRTLFWRFIEVLTYFVLGLLPGLDNFSHIGGFLMGIMLGIALLNGPMKIRAVSQSNPAAYLYTKPATWGERFTNLRLTFVGRHPWWYAWFVLRLVMLVMSAILFFVLLRNFYNGGGHCSWCKYLSCLPIHGWCDVGNLST